MTRKEEISKVALEYANEEVIAAPYDAFMAGAQWADVHPHWINVERLPPMRDKKGTSDIVLTLSKGGGIYFNRYDYRGNTWGNPLAFNPTHWMPLPQPPQSGSSEIPNSSEKGGEE